MQDERRTFDICAMPDLVRLVEELRATGEGCFLAVEDRSVAFVHPLADAHDNASEAEERIGDEGDPLLTIIGKLDAGEPADIAHQKHDLIVEGIQPAIQ